MIQKRTSPKKPLLAALGLACISIPYSLGYNGKYHIFSGPSSFTEATVSFVAIFIVTFPVCYLLRILGVHMGPWGGPESDPAPAPRKSKNKRKKRPNQSLVPTTTAVTPPAAQESRQPRSRHT